MNNFDDICDLCSLIYANKREDNFLEKSLKKITNDYNNDVIKSEIEFIIKTNMQKNKSLNVILKKMIDEKNNIDD